MIYENRFFDPFGVEYITSATIIDTSFIASKNSIGP